MANAAELKGAVQCIAHGRAGSWEAICLDLDIAVQGSSFKEVRSLLHEAVCTYVQDALKEADPAVRRRLLHRRAPWTERLKWAWPFVIGAVFPERPNHETRTGFELPCPA